MMASLRDIYTCYQEHIKNGLWKCKYTGNHLQEFVLMYLHELHTTDHKIKRKYPHYDRFVLNFFYTVNILKTCNKYIRVFANFMTSLYSFGEMFLYLCLRNCAVANNNGNANGEEMVSSNTLKKVIKVFQSEESHNISVCLSKDELEQ